MLLQRNSAGSENPSDVFRFLVEDRTQCCQTRRVRYSQRVDYCIQLPAPIEAATNRGKGSPHTGCNTPTHTSLMQCEATAAAGGYSLSVHALKGHQPWEELSDSFVKGCRRSKMEGCLVLDEERLRDTLALRRNMSCYYSAKA